MVTYNLGPHPSVVGATSMVSAKHAVELYDAGFARKQQSAGVAVYVAPPNDARRSPQLSAEVQAKLMAALANEAAKARAREEERRKRDPTYRPDAIDLSFKNVKAFDRCSAAATAAAI